MSVCVLVRACVQLHVAGLRGDDRTIRSSYRLLGAASLLQLLVTVALQINSFRQKQRARQEWRLCRTLRYGSELIGTDQVTADQC